MAGLSALIDGGDGAGVESDTWRTLPEGLGLSGLVMVNCPSTGNPDAMVNQQATMIIRMINAVYRTKDCQLVHEQHVQVELRLNRI